MSEYILNPEWKLKTNNGEPNFNMAVARYFVPISDAHKVNTENRELYINDYNNNICPFVKQNLAIKDYDENTIKELIDVIQENRKLSSVTMESRINHLVLDIVSWFAKEHGLDDPTWGSAYKFNDHGLGIEVALSRLQRSFTKHEALLLAKALLTSPIEISGELFALLACLYFGARNNEAAGLSFRDFIEMQEHKGEYYLRIGALTTNRGKNTLKISGKTYNAPRYVPAMDIVAKAIKARMAYLESILTFPIVDENGTFESVLDLPFGCKGNKYTKRCSADDLTKAAKDLFKNVLKFDENRLAGITELMYRDEDRYIEEKSATCYTCRRDFATELSIAFASHLDRMTYIQYLMGHKIEDQRFKRNDLTDEYYLHQMKEMLEASHRVNKLLKSNV